MTFEIDTEQYGGFHDDTTCHKDVESLLHDLRTIHALSTCSVLEIRENGKKISRDREKTLYAMAGL